MLQDMAPALAGDGPNPEYPWPRDMPEQSPVGYSFPVWEQLIDTSSGRQLIQLLDYLFQVAEEYM
jgi:hypothetical protein